MQGRVGLFLARTAASPTAVGVLLSLALLPAVSAAGSSKFRGSLAAGLAATGPELQLLAEERQPSALPPAFFRNPGGYPGSSYQAQRGPTNTGPVQQAGGCHPKCAWTCGTASCDESCDPVCAPPQCETACPPINAATCRHRCEPPKCAIVCPSMHCEHGDCPQCKTVCGPPKCETICAEECESKCAEPQCSWKCQPGKCDQPKCTLTCGGASVCGFDKEVNAKPEFKSGMHTMSAGLAAFDPSTLGVGIPASGAPVGAAPPQAPAPGPAVMASGYVAPLAR